jgi:hypothetical protein
MKMLLSPVEFIMTKFMLSTVVVALAGCASMGAWRELRIDGSSESAFDESLSLLNAELPYSHRQMFALALVDIVRTEGQISGQTSDGGEDGYTDEEYRRQLNGLTYAAVIALADQTGPSIWRQYYSGVGRRDPWEGRPLPQTDPNRFPASLVMPPGLSQAPP